MIHPKLCVNALSSFSWNFDQDLALWKQLGIGFAGLLISKIDDDVDGKLQRLVDAGIRPSVIVCGGFSIGSPDSWNRTRDSLNRLMASVAEVDKECIVYFPPGKTSGGVWEEVAGQFAEAVAPCVEFSRGCGVKLAFEPTHRTDASFVGTLKDGLKISKQTGLGIVLDFGNCWMESELRSTILAAGADIALVQIDDIDIGGMGKPQGLGRVQIGDGELPLRRLMQDVIDSGYQGVYDLEVIGPSAEKEGYERALNRGVVSASRLLADAGI
jgi:sugar phosphate isomerase/epimerase